MVHVLIQGPSYRNLAFDEREAVRKHIREKLESNGLRFVEYNWVWDEQDRCLLLAGTYRNLHDARTLIEMLEAMGFEICTRMDLPGNAG